MRRNAATVSARELPNEGSPVWRAFLRATDHGIMPAARSARGRRSMAYYGVYRGQVVDASTLGANGKVKVVVPSIDSTALWAPVCYSCSCAWGIRAGSQAIVAFENGSPNYPIVIGQID
jgi:Type VI secretion system/phage-baseplate injector OB domain